MKRALRKRYGRALVPVPYSKKNLFDPESMIMLQPYRGGWIVDQRGEYMGHVRKSPKSGWKIDASYKDTTGRFFQACELATRLLDERGEGFGHARHNVQMMPAFDPEARRQTREGLSYTQHFTAPGIYPGLEEERAVARKRSGR